jgi:hypothetical protein
MWEFVLHKTEYSLPRTYIPQIIYQQLKLIEIRAQD